MNIKYEMLFTVVSSPYYWIVAVVASIIFAAMGYHQEDCGECECNKCGSYDKCNMTDFGSVAKIILKVGSAISDFLGSILGWGAFYLMAENIQNKGSDNLSIFFGIVAAIGMTGFSYKFTDIFKKRP